MLYCDIIQLFLFILSLMGKKWELGSPEINYEELSFILHFHIYHMYNVIHFIKLKINWYHILFHYICCYLQLMLVNMKMYSVFSLNPDPELKRVELEK